MHFSRSKPNLPAVRWKRAMVFAVLLAAEGSLRTTAAAPEGLLVRAGDRTVTLHWNAVPGAGAYEVVRSRLRHGPCEPLSSSPVKIQSIADTQVQNGETWFYKVRALTAAGPQPFSDPVPITPKPFAGDDEFLEYVQAAAFDYFWFEAHPQTGLVRDRSEPDSPVSIAAVGFGLTALGIGIDHGWITREQGQERVRRILETLWKSPQSGQTDGSSGYRGWFYHFLDPATAFRYRKCELSSIDTALLMTGALYAVAYFDRDIPVEKGIRELAARLFERIDWQWMLNDGATLSMGWHPETGFISARWRGYNEASILYLLGLGATGASRLNPGHWQAWTSSYDWQTSYDLSFVHFPPLFGHQYSACWIDYRGIADNYMAAKGTTYFENSRRATLAQRAYCTENPKGWKGYGPDVWGLTASDGPAGYAARGAPPPENDDGTLAPTAAGGSMPFTPEESTRMLRKLYREHRTKIWCGYGFRDAFNLQRDWWAEDVLGIDQGPMLIMIENARGGRVWEVMKRSETLRAGLKRAGFKPAAR